MEPVRPPLKHRRRVFSGAQNTVRVPSPDSTCIFEAAQRLSNMSSLAMGRKKRKTNKSRSQIIIIGPFPDQVLDLSSSSSSSASESEDDSESEDGMLSPPTTPTRPGGNDVPLVDSPPSPTDWVEYSAPQAEDEELGHDLSFTSGTSSLPSTHALPCYGLFEPAILVPQEAQRVSSPGRDTAFVQKLLQQLVIRSSPPKYTPRRPTPAPGAPGPKKPTPNRIVPLPFDMFSFSSQATIEPSSQQTLVLADDEMGSDPSLPVAQVAAEADLFSDSKFVCTACDGRDARMFQLRPCNDLVCPTCFASSIAAVSVTQGPSKCPACMERVSSFEPYKPGHIVAVRGPRRRKISELDDWDTPDGPGETVVMRIDNVAWDIEPSIVERFLPAGVFPLGHPQPVHICIDRNDGRTKDYMYIEVASQAAARRILQTRQNSLMPGGRITGGRKRAVTITQVTHQELLSAIRPNSRAELDSLLELCEAALTMPAPQVHPDSRGRGRLHASVGLNGKVHYLKYRHAPFHVLISLMSKMYGTESPVYWDLFRVASGAISALGNTVKRSRVAVHGDRSLLARLNRMFDQYFTNRPKT